MSETIKCAICGEDIHSVALHLKKAHPEITPEQYAARFPDQPLLSEAAKRKIAEAQAASAAAPLTMHAAAMASAPSNVVNMPKSAAAPAAATAVEKADMHTVFGLTDGPAVRNKRGEALKVSRMVPSPENAIYVPPVDKGHVWNIDDLKNQLMALELNLPLYIYGHKGTGKTTDIEQICAATRRPLLRVQHTVNTEESHIVGQYTIQNGQTVFELGPLPLAMLNGWVYLADEYDFALPAVLSVYQPVLEGKSLLIKEAPAHLRIIRPHPQFRFVATGNTNGSGDETGLYSGTSIQNSANYDRFQMVLEKHYMDPADEARILHNRSGMAAKDCEKLVKLANDIRREFDGGKLSDTISTRALVSIAQIGLRKADMTAAINLCYANKLTKVDRAAVASVAARHYGT